MAKADFSESLYIIRYKGQLFRKLPFIFFAKNKKMNIFLKKVARKFGGIRKMLYLCTRNSEMMLTLTKISCSENESGV